jgi:hypothetical protein
MLNTPTENELLHHRECVVITFLPSIMQLTSITFLYNTTTLRERQESPGSIPGRVNIFLFTTASETTTSQVSIQCLMGALS